MTYKCICNYCGHQFEYVYASDWGEPDVKCPGCGDSSIKARPKEAKQDVFGYDSQTPRPDAYIRRRS